MYSSIHHSYFNKIFKLTVTKFFNVKSLFIQPIMSNVVGTYLIDYLLKSEPFDIKLNNFKYKYFFVKLCDNQSIVIQLCHE